MKALITILFLASVSYLIYVLAERNSLEQAADESEQKCLEMEKRQSGEKRFGKYPLSDPGLWRVSPLVKITRLDKPRPERDKWKWGCDGGMKELVDWFYFDAEIDVSINQRGDYRTNASKNCIGFICKSGEGRYVFSSASCDGFSNLAENRKEWLHWTNPSYCVCPQYVFETPQSIPNNKCNIARGSPLK